MAENSKIEWTHHTFNPWRGCTKVSEGCKFCYAETLSGRNPAVLGVWGPKGTRVIASEAMWREPLKWNEKAKQAGERHRVFCASLADVFEGFGTMPAFAAQSITLARARLWKLIEDTPFLDWLLLTKRPENIQGMVYRRWWEEGFPPNVWIGTSVENQATADERIPHLLKVPAAVRFLSCEPLLGAVDLKDYFGLCHDCDDYISAHRQAGAFYHDPMEIHWVIVGGESGSHARPMHPQWARSLRDQCQSAQIPFFFKQWGEWSPFATQAGYKAGTLSPGVDEIIGGDCGGVHHGYRVPIRERNERLYGNIAKWDEPIRMVEIRKETSHTWGKENALTMTYLRVGKKDAGRVLDDRTWDEFPERSLVHV